MKDTIATAVIILAIMATAAVRGLAQQSVSPEELKLNLPTYKNRYIVLKDIYTHQRAGVPLQLSKAGYEASKYYTFGLRIAGIRCFLRRTSANEKLLQGIRNGEKITVSGYLKQPKMKVREGSRFRDTVKLDTFVLEVRNFSRGW